MTAELDMKRIPEHIAIIMDGNGRWAMDRGLDRTFGHKEGVETVKKITSECARLGVKYLTLYTFSTENWNRPAYEIEALMGLVLSFVEMDLFTDNSIRFRMVGDMDRLPQSVQDKIHYMEDLTKDGKRMTVIMAMSYSSKQELTRATQCAYSEFYFCDTYWPDFDEEALHKAIANYQSRQRRFGKTEAQVESEV